MSGMRWEQWGCEMSKVPLKEFTYKQRPVTDEYERGYERIFGDKNSHKRDYEREKSKKGKVIGPVGKDIP